MIRASSVNDLCGGLFADYPLAVRDGNWIRSVQSMVLCVPDGDGSRFFVLVRDSSEGVPCYSVVPWHTDGQGAGGPRDAGDGHQAPHVMASAVTRGTPVPRHGSLFGWLRDHAVSALIAVYADHAPDYPEPSWAVMPLATAPARSWPPFTREDQFGPWFWEHYRAGRIVSLAADIASRPGTVFWMDTQASLGWDCCVVARDIRADDGYLLPRGCYLYYEGLRTAAAPPVDTLLTSAGRTDLAPRLRPLAQAAG
jgi:hypothetical protein